MDTTRQVEALYNEEIDLGFSIRIGKAAFEPARPGISWQNLASELLVAVLPERHVLAENKQVLLDELARLPFVGSSLQLNPQTGDYTPTLYEEAGFRPIQYLACDVPLRFPQLNLVSDGLGVSLASLSVQKKSPAVSGVVYRPLTEELVGSHTFLWQTARTSPILENFLHLANEESLGH